uniref:Double-strand break repair protein n=1 Tax=Leersia perrieri TaxID=77586 RepID=A0A0D9X4Y8_9ORYZ
MIYKCVFFFFRAEEESSTLRILVATDCHLGYLEKDEVRRFDSFDTFEEICSLAVLNKVDFILLGGDLFHENKPSTSTLVKSMEIIRRYCLNDRKVQFQVVSDQSSCLKNRFGRVNFEDPNLNIGLPVFTIHGTHDGPAGVDGMSTIDILSACNFVNYFGKVDAGSSDGCQISVCPILIKKGTTSVALYGLGNIRDQNLSRMLQTPHKIEWIKAESEDDWFNLFVLHQKRHAKWLGSSTTNGINEQLLPHFLDLVIWGHEHECLTDPQEVPGTGFHIIQPGSSVTTSLSNAEAKQKNVVLLEIKGRQYRQTNIPLKSVRPFGYAEVGHFQSLLHISLHNQSGVEPNNEASLYAHLDEIVSNLIDKTSTSGSEPNLPLVRVKVDYSGFSTIIPQRFGQKYVGKVANPNDILLFSRSIQKNRARENTDGSEQLEPNDLDQQTIEELIAQSNLKMQILDKNDLDSALHDFVNKDDSTAFHSCLDKNIDAEKKKLTSAAEDFRAGEDILLQLDQCMQERMNESSLTSKERSEPTSSSQSLPTNALSAFQELKCSPTEEQDGHESDELIETSDEELSQLAPQKRPAPVDGGSASTRRRKTDLTSFYRPMSKNDGDGAKKDKAPVAGRLLYSPGQIQVAVLKS